MSAEITEETKAGWRKVIVTLIGAVLAVIGLFAPSLADKIGPVADIVTKFLVEIIIGFLVIYYNKKNVEQKVQLAQLKVDQTQANVQLSQSVAVNTVLDKMVVKAPAASATITVPLIKDRLETTNKLVSTDTGMWDYLIGSFENEITREMQHMLLVNPNMSTIDAVKQVVDQYLGVQLSEQDCQVIQGILGLPQVLSAYSDVRILGSFRDAANAKALPQYIIETFRAAAVRINTWEIIEEVQGRVNSKKLTADERRLAMQEFGLTPEATRKAEFSGGMSWYWTINGYMPFNGYAILGYNMRPRE